MLELLLIDNPFRHVSTENLLAPLAPFYRTIWAGCENSVVLGEQRLLDEFRITCNDAVAFAQRAFSGQVATPSQEMLELARRAIQSCDARKDEDVQAWAERLARDVGHLTD